MNKGKLIQVMGSVFDAKFMSTGIPAVYNAVEVQGDFGTGRTSLWGEVQQHLGDGKVRIIALGSTFGLRRGMDVMDTGSPLTVRSASRRSAGCLICSERRLTNEVPLRRR